MVKHPRLVFRVSGTQRNADKRPCPPLRAPHALLGDPSSNPITPLETPRVTEPGACTIAQLSLLLSHSRRRRSRTHDPAGTRKAASAPPAPLVQGHSQVPDESRPPQGGTNAGAFKRVRTLYEHAGEITPGSCPVQSIRSSSPQSRNCVQGLSG